MIKKQLPRQLIFDKYVKRLLAIRRYYVLLQTRLHLTSHDWDSIDYLWDCLHFFVFVRPMVCDFTQLGLNQLFVGLTTFV